MKDLIQRIIDGDKGAFDELVKKYSPFVTMIIYKASRKYSFNLKKEDVEDLRQDVFLSLMEDDFRRLRRWRGDSSFDSYLKVVVTNLVVDFLRKQRDPEDISLKLVDPTPSPEDVIDKKIKRKIIRKIIREIIKKLPPSDQLLLKLVYYKGISPKEVCKIMNITKTAYFNRHSRIKKKIKEEYKKRVKGE